MWATLPGLAADARGLLDASTYLIRLISIWREGKAHMEPQQTQYCFDCLNRVFADTMHIEELDTPKKHMQIHLCDDLHFLGNPQYYANWLDESWNKLLKALCRLISQGTFVSFLLLRMRDALKLEASKRKSDPLL